jgi:protein-export membrane protein SecD
MQTWKLKKKTQKKAKKPWGTRIATIIFLLATVVTAGYNFPSIWNNGAHAVENATGWLPMTLREEPFRLGLDLQGGTHLIYEADMSDIDEEDRLEALEGVRDVIERRVNAFGVSEPVVQTTTTGGTYRVIIELAGVLEVNEAISLIGETPVLEFKEPGAELDREPTIEELDALDALNLTERKAAQDVLTRSRAGEDFEGLVLEYSTDRNISETRGIIENITSDSYYADFASVIESTGLTAGQVYRELVENEDGISIFRLISTSEKPEMFLSHILICYEGTSGCDGGVSELDASIQISTLRDEATPENFADLAQAHSTGPSASVGGELGWGFVDNYVATFGLAAASLDVGEISEPVLTEFGYHLIYKHDQRQAPVYTIERILMPLSDIFDIIPEASPWVNTNLSGKDLERAATEFDANSGAPYVALTFNSQGGDLFGQLTESHIGEPIAIFLDGIAISTPVVQSAIYGGRAVITGDFTVEEAKLLAQRLNAGALPVPVNLLSQQTIGPTLGAISLEKSITAALYGFLLVGLYMVALYRLPGLIAVVALLLFAGMNLAAYRIFGVTITLAGIAGFVLSLGIAVDANVLIIERFKEEFASGRDFVSSLDEAFTRAWTAIRDGNITTLIAAGVLYWFSSSFIRGFALTLSIGVILSMLTAITVTRVYLKTALEWKKIRIPTLFGVKEDQ